MGIQGFSKGLCRPPGKLQRWKGPSELIFPKHGDLALTGPGIWTQGEAPPWGEAALFSRGKAEGGVPFGRLLTIGYSPLEYLVFSHSVMLVRLFMVTLIISHIFALKGDTDPTLPDTTSYFLFEFSK